MNNQRSETAKSGSLKAAGRVVLTLGLLTAATTASADTALPAAATQAFATLGGYVSEMLTSTWGVAVPCTLGLIGIKLFKKGANKAT
ncbi:major coat protein [Vibrio campbellii]|uniref:major coat protein n=1 Tax=Vibrio campbellii TaxID=680 RepID=UPI000531ADE5|nr:major coat protein [Vibrio campbellii]AUV86195.1 hypothetical protein C1N50_08570 [Vibrio campbellii]KGR35535.1 major coat protein [Vibrio campbellii]HDM8237208.1 hypothetical protein [Vibrio campbellii]